ncbi:MAG TPA: hypothetical protein VI299_17725 [Polyangiales bacterium]
MPAPQGTGGTLSPSQYSPATQSTQVAGMLPLAGAVWRVPEAHAPSATQRPELGLPEYSPSGQAAQI